MNSLVDWRCLDILKCGYKAHHKKTNNMNMRKEDGTMGDNYKENMRVLHSYFQILFKNHQPTYFRILDIVKQRQKKWDLD